MRIHFIPKPDCPSSSGHSGACKQGKLLPYVFQRWLKVSGILHEDGFTSPGGREKVCRVVYVCPPPIWIWKSSQWHSKFPIGKLFLCEITPLNVRKRGQLVQNTWKKTWSSIGWPLWRNLKWNWFANVYCFFQTRRKLNILKFPNRNAYKDLFPLLTYLFS